MLVSAVTNERDDANYERYGESRIHNRSGKMERTSLRAKVKWRRRFNTHVRYTRNLASPRVPTEPKGSAQSLSQLGPTAQWGRLRKRADDRSQN